MIPVAFGCPHGEVARDQFMTCAVPRLPSCDMLDDIQRPGMPGLEGHRGVSTVADLEV